MMHAVLAAAFISLFAGSLVTYARERRAGWIVVATVNAMGAAWQIARMMQL